MPILQCHVSQPELIVGLCLTWLSRDGVLEVENRYFVILLLILRLSFFHVFDCLRLGRFRTAPRQSNDCYEKNATYPAHDAPFVFRRPFCKFLYSEASLWDSCPNSPD